MLADLIKQYPAVALAVLIIIIILVAIIIIQGRSIDLPWLKIGSKAPKKTEIIQSKKQTPPQTQTQNVHVYASPPFTEEQIDDVARRVAAQIPKFQSEIANDPDLLYHPPSLLPRIIYLHATIHDFTNKLRNIVVNEGGGWAGISMAGFGNFFDKAVNFNLLPKALITQISDFYIYVQVYTNADNISDRVFLDIQYLATNIIRGLDDVIANMPRKYLPDKPDNNALG
jgi:hypothetical protein